ncbi:MAPEG family protein [Jannaschia sp. Os4]|uniref:MAPEG family protein n=1 Tax=Jannaschia sp. Os4 TaxID=2807617 RepID=UPI0031B63E4A
MSDRALVALGMLGGALWAIAVVATGVSWGGGWSLPAAMAAGLLPVGLVLAAMIGVLAARRFRDDALRDGRPMPEDPTQRVLSNTVEQTVLGLCLWPFAGWVVGTDLAVVLGWSFALTRLIFWAGYVRSPPLRAFGFAAGFYPTLLATGVGMVEAARTVGTYL